jgi:hypothetical protein
MRFNQLPLALFTACALAACGGDGQTAMGVSISRSELAEDVVKVRVQVHVQERSCDDVRNSGPEKRASYSTDGNLKGARTGDAQINEIRPGTYTIAVWTFGEDMKPREFGCRERVDIEEGAMTEVPIVVEAL